MLTFLLTTTISLTFSKPTLPWTYKGFESFPAFFFGASHSGLETNAVMKLASRHQIAGWGWQQNNTGLPGSEELNLLKQSRAFNTFLEKNNLPKSDSNFVYRSGYAACTFFNTSVAPVNVTSNLAYRDFWVQNENGQVCWHKPTSLWNDLNGGPIYNFTNPLAFRYYVDRIVGEIVQECTSPEGCHYNSVFFDLCDWLACDFHWASLTNCTNWVPTMQQKIKFGRASVQLFAEITTKLNMHGIIPVISFRTLLKKYVGSTSCVIPEEEWITALQGKLWIRYQEYWPDYSAKTKNSVNLRNMIEEFLQFGTNMIPSTQVHAYNVQPNAKIDPYYIGSYLLVQDEYGYFSASNGWFDENFSWHPEYDYKCGKPVQKPFQVDATAYFRGFENCSVLVDYGARTAQIKFI